jgi:hypothetical protein
MLHLVPEYLYVLGHKISKISFLGLGKLNILFLDFSLFRSARPQPRSPRSCISYEHGTPVAEHLSD